MLNSMIIQLDKEYLKPVTLKKVVEAARASAVKLAGEDNYLQM
jgi:hypothetical protein